MVAAIPPCCTDFRVLVVILMNDRTLDPIHLRVHITVATLRPRYVTQQPTTAPLGVGWTRLGNPAG